MVVSRNGCRAGCFGELTLPSLSARQAELACSLWVERIHLDRVGKGPESSSSRQNRDEFFPSLLFNFFKDVLFYVVRVLVLNTWMCTSGVAGAHRGRRGSQMQVVLQTCEVPCGFWE